MGNSSNAGFVGLMTPTGILLLIVAFTLLIAITIFGATLIRAGERRAREYRAELKRQMESKEKDA